jgi:hypothetical protein
MILLGIALVLLTIIFHAGCGMNNELKSEKVQMERFLKEKYGKEFVVENVQYYREFLGGKRKIEAEAHPYDDATLSFRIAKSGLGSEKYQEWFFDFLWEKQVVKKWRAVLNSGIFRVRISYPALYMDSDLHGRTIGIDQALNEFPQKIKADIYYGVFDDMEERGKLSANEILKVYSLVKKLKDRRYVSISLEFYYLNKKYRIFIKENEEEILRGGFVSSNTKIKTEEYMVYRFIIENINDISEPDDIHSLVIDSRKLREARQRAKLEKSKSNGRVK